MVTALQTKIIVEKLRKETELRVEIFNEGMNFTPESIEGLGTKWTEDIAGLFAYHFEGWKPGVVWPECFKLPLGTTSKIVFNINSPYLVRKDGDALILEKNGKFVTTLEYVQRPKYYSLKHTDGRPMWVTGGLMAYSGISTSVFADCMYWKTDDQCRFCNSNAVYEGGKANYDKGKHGGLGKVRPAHQIAETFAAAIGSGVNSMLISCGTRPEEDLIRLFIEALNAIKEHTGMTGIATINTPALKNLENIDRLYEAGARALIMDQEVWDENSFKSLCPGKSKNVGRDNWIKSLEYAAKYTHPEKGIAFSVCALVLGLEQKSKYIEAANFYADRNIPVHLPPWKVLKGSNLYGHRSPHAAWIMEVMDECMEIQFKKMPWLLTLPFWRHTFQHCWNGAKSVIWWDWVRRAMIEKGLITIEDQQIQDWQLAGVPWDHIQKVLTEKKLITEADGHVRDWPKQTDRLKVSIEAAVKTSG